MSFLLIIVVLGLGTGDTIHPPEYFINASASSPLLTSGYMNESGGLSSDSYVTSVLQLLKVLQWDHVIFLFEHDQSDDLQLISPVFGLASIHDLDECLTSFEIKQLLQHLHKKFFPKLQFILLSSYKRAVEVLQIVDNLDLESNRTTDFRHYSFWMVACASIPLPSTRVPSSLRHLENVVLITAQSPGGATLRQLLISPGGRSFSSGKQLKEFKEQQDVFPNTRYGLNNRILVVSTKEGSYKSFVVRNENGLEGYCLEVLKAIATALNFSYEIVHPPDNEWGRKLNGSWNGLLGQLERRDVDLVVASISIHEDREKVMDFLYPPIFTLFDDIIYRLESEKTERWKIYLKPFKPSVLIILFVTLFVFALMTYIFLACDDVKTGRSRRSDPSLRNVINKMTAILLYLLGILLMRGLESNSRRNSSRILLFTWGMFSVIVAAYYSANLVAMFAVKKQKLPFTSLRELVRQKEYKWGFKPGSIREHIFRGYRTGDMKLAWEGVLKFNKTDPEVLSKNTNEHTHKLKTEKYAYITSRLDFERIKNGDCNIRKVGDDIIWHQIGIGVPTDYPLSREIENVWSKIADSGLPDIWWRRWGRSKPEECIQDATVNPLTLPVVASAFYILCIGFGIAGIGLVVEIMLHKR